MKESVIKSVCAYEYYGRIYLVGYPKDKSKPVWIEVRDISRAACCYDVYMLCERGVSYFYSGVSSEGIGSDHYWIYDTFPRDAKKIIRKRHRIAKYKNSTLEVTPWRGTDRSWHYTIGKFVKLGKGG